MITDTKWWATAGVLVGLFVAWVVFPRYDVAVPIREGLGLVVVRTDRWTGRVDWMRLSPETVRRYPGGTLTSDSPVEMHDTSFDGDVRRLQGVPKNTARLEDIIEVVPSPPQ